MFEPDQDGNYAIIAASAGRRLMGGIVIYSLGLLLLYVAMLPPFKALMTPLLLATGVAVLLLAERMRKATLNQIFLTATDVRDSTGEILARMDDIVGVDRGAFALKPSNGFTLILRERQPRGWAPGLWWRLGRRLGVGGVTAAGQSKFMAEQIALRLAQRDRD